VTNILLQILQSFFSFEKFSELGVSASIPFMVFLLQSEKRMLISDSILSITAKTFLLNVLNELGSSTSTGASTMVSTNLEHNLRFLRLVCLEIRIHDLRWFKIQ
jgi:hypothetical protein